MTKIKLDGFIQAKKYYVGDEMHYTFSTGDSDMSEFGWMNVCPHTLEFEIPESFNPIAAEVEVLEKEKARVVAEMTGKVKRIEDHISNLQCLAHDSAVTA